MKVVCIDSDYDEATKNIAEWRKSNTHVYVQNFELFESTILRQNLAVRIYLEQELLNPEVVLLSGTGHGLFSEFLGNDGLPALEEGRYNPVEANKKIIHLLSCNTAFRLGPDLVSNGCLAFFGYDIPFTYHAELIDIFMQPDHALVTKLLEGASALEVHDTVIRIYNEMIEALVEEEASVYAITDMETDRDHFCSPSKHEKWGNENASLNTRIA